MTSAAILAAALLLSSHAIATELGANDIKDWTSIIEIHRDRGEQNYSLSIVGLANPCPSNMREILTVNAPPSVIFKVCGTQPKQEEKQ